MSICAAMDRLRWIALALVASIIGLSRSVAGQVSIPFTNSADGFVIVPVSVGEIRPIHVIFDTGAGLDVLAPSVIRRLHGRPAGEFTGFRMYGDRLDIQLFVVPTLAIGPVVKTEALVGTWDVLDSLHVDGVISANDFRDQPFTFDFIKKIVVFETTKTLAARRAGGVTRRIQTDDLRGRSLELFTSFSVDADSGQCNIDTGSPTATVNLRYMSALGIAKDGPSVRKHDGHNAMTGAPQVTYGANVSRVALVGNSDIGLVRPRVSFGDIMYDCVVGVDFWAGRVVTLDIRDRELIVSRGSQVGRSRGSPTSSRPMEK
jgi:hypothetical protein